MLRLIFSASLALGALAPVAVEAASSCGYASHYGRGDGFAWRTMANGQPMNPNALTTAHRTLPLGSKIIVTNPANGKSVKVTVTDRGPFHGDRRLDLSHGAFSRVAEASQGVARLCFSLA
jgi:rare lipoprotein A